MQGRGGILHQHTDVRLTLFHIFKDVQKSGLTDNLKMSSSSSIPPFSVTAYPALKAVGLLQPI